MRLLVKTRSNNNNKIFLGLTNLCGHMPLEETTSLRQLCEFQVHNENNSIQHTSMPKISKMENIKIKV